MGETIGPVTEYSHGPCEKSLVFKYYESSFYKNGRFESKQGLRLLKRKSCMNCNYCKYVEEALVIAADDELDLPRFVVSLQDKYDLKSYHVNNDDEFTAHMHDEYEVVMVKNK